MPAPQALDFTDADFETTAASALDFTDEDFAPRPLKVALSPYDKQKLDTPMGPMGPFGPLNPSEVLALPQILKAPAAAIEQTGIPGAVEDIAADFLRRTGINPAAQAGVPLAPAPEQQGAQVPSPLEEAFPGFAKGMEESFRGMTTPGQAMLAPFSALKPVQAGFTAQVAAGIPESIQQAFEAKTPEAAGQAAVQLGIGAAMGAHLLPRASRLAETLTEKGLPDASEVQKEAEVHGNVRPLEEPTGQVPVKESGPGVQPQAAPVAQVPHVPLTQDELAYIDAEREGLGVPIEVQETSLGGNEPFAGQIATIDRQKGSIRINPQEFSAWLKQVPAANRTEAVKSLLGEEKIHLAVDDGSATAYWQDLTSIEKAIERRRYTGKWGGVGLDDTMMGHEAVRFRLQQLARMTPREIADANWKSRIGMKAITTLEDTVRSLRQTFGTKASLEQLAILDRLQENIAAAKGAAQGVQPGAYRKGRKETSEQDIMFLPPVPKIEDIERHVFPSPTPIAIENAAAEHFNDALAAGRAPSFEDFQNELKGQYGSGIPKDALWYTWQDAMTKRLMNAPGAELDRLIDSMELRGRLQGEHQAGFTRSTPIADPIDVPKAHQAQFEEMARLFPHKKVITPRSVRQWFGPALRRRYAAIGTLMDELSREAGPKPEKPWDRSEVGPEEVAQIGGNRQFRAITPEESVNPATLGEIATRNAAVEASGKGAPPRTVTKNVLAVSDKSGRIILVSAWKDPRTGPKVTDPSASNVPGRKIDARFTADYKPLAVITLREPVQGFRQVFPDQAAFDKWFGDVGIEGTPGIRSSMFAGPQAGITEGSAGRTTTEPEPLTFKESDFVSPTATELTSVPRGTIPTGQALYRSPRPEPPLGEQLPLNARLDVQRRAREGFPYEPTQYTPSAALEARGIQIMPGARGERTPAALNKQRQAINDQMELIGKAVTASVLRRQTKQAIPRLIDAADGNTAMAASNARFSIERAFTKELPQGLTGKAAKRALAENLKDAEMARQAGIAYIASGKLDAHGNWKPNPNRLTKGTPARGARPAEHSFEALLKMGEDRATTWLTDPNPLKRIEAKKDLAYIAKLRESLEYAKANWNEPHFQQGAEQARKELHDAIQFETQNGFPTTEHENYIPGRYEGDFWNDNLIRFAGKKLLGTAYRLPKRFKNPFEAIAHGPFRMSSLDLAKLAEHRISQGRRMVEQDVAFRALKNMTDPSTGKPVAMNPSTYKVVDPVTQEETLRYKSPDPNYVLLRNRPSGIPIAVRDAYAGVIDAVTSRSYFEGVPGAPSGGLKSVAKGLLTVNQMLKHGAILLWDSFHPGRIGQYVMALNGWKGAGYKGGYTALTVRPIEMADAVRKGLVTKAAADWATGQVRIGKNMTVTRQQLLSHLVENGLNAQKITDALYRTAIEHVPFIGKPYHALISPYNEGLFQRFIPGVIAETAVNNFERMRAKNPNMRTSDITKEIVTDTNVFFGNLGRQGVFKSKTAQQLFQIAFLAPGWQEGLFQKEVRGAARLAGAAARGVGLDLPYRRDLPAMGMLGEGMARGLASYIIGTQLINLATRQKFTWQNEEAGHKLDAYLKLPWMKEGVWLSPLSVFAEVTHDLVRMLGTKDKAWDAIHQMGENRLSPVGKMALILASGVSPQNQYYSTTPGVLWGALSQVVPGAGANPISLAVPAREIGHALAPNLISPNQPGALFRQMLAAGSGTKTELPKTATQQMYQLTREFMQREGLQKDTGWKEVQTDDPSYSKLRTALRLDDPKQAKRLLNDLRKNRSDADIEKAMAIWSKRPWTGSIQNDNLLRFSMSEKDANLMSQADEERMELLEKFYEVMGAE